jgi:putative hydrolase of the HAD superfamily
MSIGPQIEAVTFDVGGTLIEPWPSVGHVYSQVAARHGLRVEAEVLNERFARAWKAKSDFGHSMSDWSNLVDVTFAGLTETPPSQTFFPDLYDAFSEPKAWHIFPDVIPCLEKLRKRHVRLAVISNWDERLKPLLKRCNFTRFFETVIVSIEIGTPKPSPKIFAAAAEELRLDPKRILHVGDSSVEDVEGAQRAGFSALLIDRNKPPVENQRISSLMELTLLADS